MAPGTRSAGGAKLAISELARTETTADIVVSPTGGYFQIGDNAVNFPAHSICALTSTYGVTEWDKPCRPEKNKVKFHVEVISYGGQKWMEFTPAVRFVPTTKSDGYVYLYMFVADTASVDESKLSILWSPLFGMPGIDESLMDSTLRTSYRADLGLVYRRIKHFSFYTIHEGPCVPTPEQPVCPPPSLDLDQ